MPEGFGPDRFGEAFAFPSNRLERKDHVMQGAAKRVRMTYKDLVKLPDDGLRHELIDGEHYVTPSPVPRHQLIAGNLHLIIGNYVRERGLGVIAFAPLDVVFTQHDVVVPDLLYFTKERYRETITEKNAQGAPNLVVEILSPGTRRRDEGLKRALYERMRVEEYWIVDPKREIVTAFRLQDGRYERKEYTSADAASLTTPLLPDLVIPLKAVFELP
jgi:Uma2 family endonuclease